MFERCCHSRTTTPYKIVHDPKPILLSNDMDTIIKELLWYAPNIDSFQAVKNELIQDKVYDDFSFSYIMKQMGMDEKTDVKWIDKSDTFDDEDWSFYENEICCECQKIIITRIKKLSKTNDLLRCIRNCIAHGHFAIVGEYIIGFNKEITQSHPEGIKRAVIKLKPELLLRSLESLLSPMAKELLVGYALERVGYSIVKQSSSINLRHDLVVEKDDRKYAIEIKDYRGCPYIHPEHIKKQLSRLGGDLPGVERVLFIDTSRVTKDVRIIEHEIDNFRIIDLSQVKELLKEEPIDILA